MHIKDIPQKNTGDEYTAEECNAMVDGEIIRNENPTTTALPGIPVGSILNNKSVSEIFQTILYQELFGKITEPSYSFTITPSSTLQEVGAVINIVRTRDFSRGSINPQYQSESPYRSGPLIDYTETGSDNHTITLGIQSWTSRANYSKGVQPKGNYGSNTPGYLPLPEGFTDTVTRSITGVYPVYATTANIGLLTKQPLLSHGADIQVSMVAESGGKQTIRIPQEGGTITVLQQYNTLSGQWDNISLSSFTKTAIQVIVNGNTVDYWEYIHNGATIGARQLKFKV